MFDILGIVKAWIKAIFFLELGNNSEDEALLEMEENRQPGWDRPGLVAGASKAIELFGREIAVKGYGEDIVRDAEKFDQEKLDSK